MCVRFHPPHLWQEPREESLLSFTTMARLLSCLLSKDAGSLWFAKLEDGKPASDKARNFWFFFLLLSFSHTQVVIKKWSNENFFVQKRSLSEIIIIWKKTLSFWSEQFVIWWLFNDNLKASEQEREEKGTTNSSSKSYICEMHQSSKWHLKNSSNKFLTIVQTRINIIC